MGEHGLTDAERGVPLPTSKHYDTDEEIERKKRRQRFDEARGYAGLGGAGKKSKVRKEDYEADYSAWESKTYPKKVSRGASLGDLLGRA